MTETNVETEPLELPGPVAAYLKMTEGALAQLRYTGRGPKFIKVSGRAVRYRWSDVYEWVENRTRERTD